MLAYSPAADSGSTIETIPNETLAAIFDGLPPTILALTARVSRRFNAISERLLYASIGVRDGLLEEGSQVPWRTQRCCESIAVRPHLAEKIRDFHIRWASTNNPPHGYFQFSHTLSLLATVLPTLISLESLELSLGQANMLPATTDGVHPIESIIVGCQFPKLKSCTLNADWTKGVQSYSGILAQFLATLPDLRHLKLLDQNGPIQLAPTCIPLLTSFRGNMHAAASLLPQRPVDSLALVGGDTDVTRENLPRIALTSVPLRHLDLSGMSVRPALLRVLAATLPFVHTVRIRLTLRHTLHYALSGIRMLSGLAAVLACFQQLVVLDLSPTLMTGIPNSTAQDERALCNEWSRACPALGRVIFPSQTVWTSVNGVWGPAIEG